MASARYTVKVVRKRGKEGEKTCKKGTKYLRTGCHRAFQERLHERIAVELRNERGEFLAVRAYQRRQRLRRAADVER